MTPPQHSPRLQTARGLRAAIARVGVGLVAALALALSASAEAGSYKLIDLGTLPGGTLSVPGGINDAGQVAGRASSPAGSRAFLWSLSTGMVDLGTPAGFSSSLGYGLNSAGQVVGTAVRPDGIAHAFLWDPATGMQDLGVLPGGLLSVAFAANASGQVVGWGDSPVASSRAFLWTAGGGMTDLVGTGEDSTLAHDINHAGAVVGVAANVAFRWTAGVFTSLGALPTGGSSEARAISANGLIVGWSDTETSSARAFLWTAGTMSDLGTLPGGSTSDAHGVNSLGQVVGVADLSDGSQRAFVWEAGVMTDLGTLPGGTMSFAYGINEAGQIVGAASDAAGRQHAVIWQPNGVPVANGQAVSTAQDTALALVLTGSDPDQDPLTFGVVSGPASGSLSGTAPALTYTPVPGFTGSDSFTFTVSDGSATSAIATVTVSVTPGAPPAESDGPARITGAGHVESDGKRHHFELRLRNGQSGDERHGRLEYRVRSRGHQGGHDWFVSTAITGATFSDAPDTQPGRRPQPTVDSVVFSGRGKWNGRSGYTFEARAVDAGEPGAGRDTFVLTITSRSGEIVASVSGLLAGGNIQSWRMRGGR